jgi:hypothetical protein
MAGPDLSIVTAAIEFSSVVGAVLGVAAAWLSVVVAVKGVRIVIATVRGHSVHGGVEEGYAQSVWHSMSVDEKSFLGVSSYEDWRRRYTVL